MKKKLQPKDLAELRELAGLPQPVLAKAVGIDRPKLSLIENGHVQPTEEELADIVTAVRAAHRERVARFEQLLAGSEAA